MAVTDNYCPAAYTIAMATVPYSAKTWLQKKECIFAVIYNNKFVITLLSMLLLTLISLQYLPRMTMKKMMIGRLGLDF